MLYKKYHRNFVKQFKKGVKFKLSKESNYIHITITDPFIDLIFGEPYVTVRIGEATLFELVYISGRLTGSYYVI